MQMLGKLPAAQVAIIKLKLQRTKAAQQVNPGQVQDGNFSPVEEQWMHLWGSNIFTTGILVVEK